MVCNNGFTLRISFYIFFLGTTNFLNIESAYLNNYMFNATIARHVRQASVPNCSPQSFTCKSGECIEEEKQCDGLEDCSDGSDEDNTCLRIRCNSNLFRCSYGACIHKSLKCNGEKDCKDNSDEANCTSTSPKPPKVGCGFTKFTCASGQCIDDSKLCDGVIHCDDESDEATVVCNFINCPLSTYRCDYGACVSRNARCNGIKECRDGSDENSCPTPPPIVTPTPPVVTVPTVTTSTLKPTPTRPQHPDGCRLPNNPVHGKFVIANGFDVTYLPGDNVPLYTFVNVVCNDRPRLYKPSPPDVTQIYCLSKGHWSHIIPTCALACPSLASSNSETTNVKCKYNDIYLQDSTCSNPVENTIAEFSCEPLYEDPGIQNNPSRLCKDGNWDYPKAQCFPVCGQKRPRGTTNIINGSDATPGDYPWQVAVYDSEYKHICGGSILNKRIVLSAAHCFTATDGSVLPKDMYHVTAGNYYRFYRDPRDKHVQFSDLEEIKIPESYRGIITSYEGDIAILILSTPFTINIYVQPVCIDLSSEIDFSDFATGKNGTVTGWGFTLEGKEQSEVLKELNVPYIPYARCFDEVPISFRKFITYDKICGGYRDGGKGVCGGDSGGPLVFSRLLNNQERYFIKGIVSTSPLNLNNGQCNSNEYGAYTSVAKHIRFVRDMYTLNRQ